MMRIYPNYHMRSKLVPGPEARTSIRNVLYEFKTYLRILHTDGKYYLQQHCYNFLKDVSSVEDAEVRYFINQMYIAIKFACVDPDAISPDGNKLFILDPDQRSELERLNLVP